MLQSYLPRYYHCLTAAQAARQRPAPVQCHTATSGATCSMSPPPARCIPQHYHHLFLSLLQGTETKETKKSEVRMQSRADSMPSLVLENVTSHVFYKTSKIAFKTSDSYPSLIFHHIPPDKLIPAFRMLWPRTTLSVSHTSWSASFLWTHSKPIS